MGNIKGTKHNKDRVEKSKRNLGLQFHHLGCPLCAHILGMKRINEGLRKFAQADLDTYLVYQIREGGGYASGFKRVGGLTLREMKNDPRFSDILDNLRKRCKEILTIIGER